MDKKETGLTNASALINPVLDIYPLKKSSNHTLIKDHYDKPSRQTLKKLDSQKNRIPFFVCKIYCKLYIHF